MATQRQVERRAEELGCDFEVLRKAPKLDCHVFSPVGKRFVEDGLHVFVGHQLPGRSPSDVFKDMLVRMAAGVEDCDDPECDSCRPADE